MEKVGVGSRRHQQQSLRSRLPPNTSRRYLNWWWWCRRDRTTTTQKFPFFFFFFFISTWYKTHTTADTTCKSFGAATAHIANGIISADISYVYNSRPHLFTAVEDDVFFSSLCLSFPLAGAQSEIRRRQEEKRCRRRRRRRRRGYDRRHYACLLLAVIVRHPGS